MPTTKDLTLTYDALNEERTFSEGDTLTGTVTMCLKKDTKVKSFFVKLKGDANVRWSQEIGENQLIHTAHWRYFKLKQYLIPENTKGKWNDGLCLCKHQSIRYMFPPSTRNNEWWWESCKRFMSTNYNEFAHMDFKSFQISHGIQMSSVSSITRWDMWNHADVRFLFAASVWVFSSVFLMT